MSKSEELSRLALEHFQSSNYVAALEHARAVLRETDDHAMMWQICGLAAMQLGQYQAGLEALEQALRLTGDDAQLLNNIGIAKRRVGDLPGAIDAYELSLKLSPDLAATHNNLADALVAQNRWEDALISFRKALTIHPQDISTRFNYANLLRDMGESAQACSQYENLIELCPNDSELKWNASLAYLARGDWGKGFEYYESRFELDHMAKPLLPSGLARWDGQPLDGKKIVVISEQGFGDLFQMLACASRLRNQGAEVSVQCHRRLHKLLLASDLISHVYDEDGKSIEADYYEWLMSCPGKLHLQAGDVPTSTHWLRPPHAGDDAWKEPLLDTQRLKVGLNFQGSPDFPHDAFRSLDVRHFMPLFERDDLKMVSIQKGFGEDQLDKLPKGSLIAVGHLLDTGDDAFVDTARCIHALDLLITSDTAVAHLAGAMGCRVWLVLSTVVDWRWGLSGSNSSWYPSMRLFRQRSRGEWGPVIEDLMQALDHELVGK